MAGNEKFNRMAVNHKTIQTLTLPPMPRFDRSLLGKHGYLEPLFDKYEQALKKWEQDTNYVFNQILVPLKHLQQQIEDSAVTEVTETITQVIMPSSGGGGSTTPAPAAPEIPLGNSVVSETEFDQTPDAGSAEEASRADHTHGTPPDPLPFIVAFGTP